MKTYPKYKESGIPWIGQIPEHWEKCRFKMLHLGTNVGEAIDKTYWTDDEKDTVFYTAGVKPIRTDFPNFPIEKFTKEEDILLARNGSPYVYLPSVHAAYTDHIIRASILPSANKVYVSHALATAISQIAVDSVSLPTWSASLWNAQVLPLPPLAEQQAIAEYLDKKTGDIDELVGLLNKQIADVRAYRQSLITETVTQGLNKDVPMKDSGIEWIGQIPKGWHLTKLKHLTSKIGSGITPTGGATIYQDSGILFIRSQNVYTDGLRLDDVAYISDEIDNNMQSSRVLYGDVLLNITGASIGRCTTFNLERTRANVNQHVCIIRPIAELLLSKYLQYTLNSNLGQIQIALYQTGGNREGLNFEQLKNFLIPDIPSLSEQQQIVEFLDAKTKDIDELLSKLEAQVADLLAYKSSLISEVVTGKIDIR